MTLNREGWRRLFEIGAGLWTSAPTRSRRRRLAIELMDLAESAIGQQADRPPRSAAVAARNEGEGDA